MSHTLNGFTDYPGESFYAVSVPKFYIFINLFIFFESKQEYKKDCRSIIAKLAFS